MSSIIGLILGLLSVGVAAALALMGNPLGGVAVAIALGLFAVVCVTSGVHFALDKMVHRLDALTGVERGGKRTLAGGLVVDASGPLRIAHPAGRWLVLGQGTARECATEEEAQAILDELKKEEK